MLTFLIGLAILFGGGLLYGGFCSKVFGPDNSRKTPALAKQDGVDYVPMPKWKNCLIELLNIAGTGPILGPIQGILFGPIAFILIPIGCVLGGAMHDFFSGMISIREGGLQMPGLIQKYLGKKVFFFYNAFLCLLLLLVVAVFVTTPGDLLASQILKTSTDIKNPIIWIIYGCIFAYYIIATLFPIDKIIGKIYPVFGAILLISAIGIFIGLFVKGYPLTNLTTSNWKGIHPGGQPILPIFFVTVACGIVSGFHSTQATLIGRSVQKESDGRMTFYNMMILEGFIAMIWAAAAMGAMALFSNCDASTAPVAVVGIVAKNMLGNIGGLIAIIGVIVLPISTGDTALRSLRLIVADFLHYDQSKKKNRLVLSFSISAIVVAILLFSKLNVSGFSVLWRYFSWSNQAISIFAFAIISIYLFTAKKPFIIAMIPGAFYAFIISCYILNAKIGFNLSLKTSYIIGALFAVLYCVYIIIVSKKKMSTKNSN